MTIIVAVKTDEKIIIGTDKRVIEGDTIVSEDSSKILIKEITVESYKEITHEKFLIAFSGLYSLFELLKTFKAPVKDSKDTFKEYLYKTFIPKLDQHLRSYNFIKSYNDGQEGVEWELLIAYKNQLFLVEYNLGIIEINTPYYATGTPRDIALVQNAIKACAAHNTTCNDHMEIYSIKSTGEIKKINYTCNINWEVK